MIHIEDKILVGVEKRKIIFDDSLKLYLPLWHPELTGNTIISKELDAISCTVTGAVWTRQGRQFDGIDDLIALSTNVTKGLSALTIIAWVKPSDKSNNISIVSDYVSDVNTSVSFMLEDYPTTSEFRPGLSLKGETTAWSYANGTGGVRWPYGVWYHLAVTWDGTIRRFYVNAVPDGTANYSDTQLKTNPTAPTTLGRDSFLPTPTGYLLGIYGEVLIYERALSAFEILHNYLAAKWRYR